jgi:hypothetical protein
MKFQMYAYNDDMSVNAGKFVSLEISEICCGIKTKILLGTKGGLLPSSDQVTSGCLTHLPPGDWITLWRNFGKDVIKTNSGMNCSQCNLLNEYAVPNQSNGTYLCYSCRS